jgi:hypothetical protein
VIVYIILTDYSRIALGTRERTSSEPGQQYRPETVGIGRIHNPSLDEERGRMIKEAIADLEKRLKSKRTSLTGQNLLRYNAVLKFLHLQKSRQVGETRIELALMVARCFNRGKFFAEKLITWERAWVSLREIPEGKQGCFQKTQSWFNDESVQLAVREWISRTGEGIHHRSHGRLRVL